MVQGIIDPGVAGKISYPKRTWSFGGLVDDLTGQCGSCTYRIFGNTFRIMARPGYMGCYGGYIEDAAFSEVQTLDSDDGYTYQIERETLTKTSFDGKTVAKVKLRRALPKATLDLSQQDDRQKLIDMAKATHTKLSIAPEMRSKVTIDGGEATMDMFVESLSKSLGIPWIDVGGDKLILRRINPYASLNLFHFEYRDGYARKRPKLKLSGDDVLVDAGPFRYRCRKSDLAILSWSPRN